MDEKKKSTDKLPEIIHLASSYDLFILQKNVRIKIFKQQLPAYTSSFEIELLHKIVGKLCEKDSERGREISRDVPSFQLVC